MAEQTTKKLDTADKMKAQKPDVNQFKKAFNARKQESRDYITNTMASSLTDTKSGLKDAYSQSKAAQKEANTAGQTAFKTARADVNVQANRNANGLNQFADVRGLNRQAGSQQALQLNRARQTAVGDVVALQNAAIEENARRQAMLKVDYNNRVQAAIANRDYRKAAALLDDFNNQNKWLETNAANLASYGNFTGYQTMYGGGTASNMRRFWIAQNPDLAYNTGAINAKQYKKMTGKDAPDMIPKAGPGGYNGGLNNWWDLPEAHGGGNTTPAPTPTPTYSNDTSAYWSDPYKF